MGGDQIDRDNLEDLQREDLLCILDNVAAVKVTRDDGDRWIELEPGTAYYVDKAGPDVQFTPLGGQQVVVSKGQIIGLRFR